MVVKEGYKLTEVGVIPEDWKVKKFKDKNVTDLITCGIAATPNYVDEAIGFPFLSSTNIKNGSIRWENFKYINPKLHRLLYRNNPPKEGDILYSRVGSIGEAAIVDVDFEFSIYVSLTLIKCGNFIHNSYLKQLLNSPFYKNLANNTVLMGGGVGNLNVNVVREFPIPIPSKSEQTAIATSLSDADALIRSLEKLIEKKRAIKQGAMQELLKPKEGWVVKRLGDVCAFFSGGTPSTSVQSFYGGNIPWITSSDLNKTIIEDVEGRITKKGLENSSSKMVKAGTLLVALYGATAGVTAITEIEAAINQAVLAVIPKEDDNFFLFYQLTKLKNWILSTFIQGGQGNLSGNIFKELELEFPEIQEQRRIAKVLFEMDSEISALEQKLSKCKMLKEGMMQELLTGRIRLNH